MSDAYNALLSLTEEQMALYGSGPEQEKHIVIGRDRFITVPDSLKRIAVQYDRNMETVTFDCPRYWDDHDMSKMVIYINYRLPDGTPDSYPADNVTVEENVMHFDWTITGNVTQNPGRLAFLVCVKKTDDNGNEENHWNSELCTDMYISEGLECDPLAVEQYPDIVTQLLSRMNSVEQVRPIAEQAAAQAEQSAKAASNSANAAGNIATTVGQYLTETKGYRNEAAIAAVEAETAAASQVGTKADAICLSAEGGTILLADSSDDPFRGLRVMGKTEHASLDGEILPTPEVPLDLASVVNPTVTVNGKNFFDMGKLVDTDLITKLADGTLSVSHYYCPTTLKLSALCPGMIVGKAYTLELDTDGNTFVYLNNYGKIWNHGASMLVTDVMLNSIVTLYGKTEQVDGSTIIRSIQFRYSETTSGYEEYREAGVMQTARTLRGIPVPANGNYTDENGQQWYCDEIDFERGVYIQRCFLETLTFTPQTELNRYSATMSHVANAKVAIDTGIPVLCTTLPFDPMCGSGNPMVNGIRIAATSPKYAIAYYNGEEIEEATVLYPLETPIETALTAEEIAAYKSLRTNRPNTVILNSANAHMCLDYNADTKTYIDNGLNSGIAAALEAIMNDSY